MRRLIVLPLVLATLGVLAIDRLTDPVGCVADPDADRAFAFPAPAPPPPPPAPPAPPCFEAGPIALGAAVVAESTGSVTVASELMATEDRALADLRAQIDREVASWLAEAGVPESWHPPAGMVDAMVLSAPEVELALQRDYGDLYRAEAPLALTAGNRASLVGLYREQVSTRRRTVVGVGLGFALASLAILAGYIRGDEATRGYYTTRLRVVAAAAFAGAAVVAYRVLS